jgi:hypothetical protein
MVSRPEDDDRQVVLLKSLATQNRFYALAPKDSGWKNADTIESFPDDVVLGIAYPCLEDGLNDFATIRTTFDTLDYFPDDQELRAEMMGIIVEARDNLRRRLTELRDRIARYQAHFLGTDVEEFKQYTLNLCTKGVIRRTIDSMMKLDVFESVAQTELQMGLTATEDTMFRYEFGSGITVEEAAKLPPNEFIVRLFDDVLEAVECNDNYQSKYTFDRNVFQKFIALMFINYATTDPMFYGTNKADYGVSADRDMSDTPLYRAVREALLTIEAGNGFKPPAEPAAPEPTTQPAEEMEARIVELPAVPVMDQKLLVPLNSICRAAEQVAKLGNPRASEYADMILKAASVITEELKAMAIVSPLARNPADRAIHSETGGRSSS